MSGRPFLDSNVLVYAVSTDDPRHTTAAGLVAAGGILSTQVLNEFANVARSKLKWPWPDVRAASSAFQAVSAGFVPLGIPAHEHALRIAERDGLAFYDALIVAAALAARCATLLTEDMQDGRVIEGRLTIRNPFVDGGL